MVEDILQKKNKIVRKSGEFKQMVEELMPNAFVF